MKLTELQNVQGKIKFWAMTDAHSKNDVKNASQEVNVYEKI
jgi:hypothetical protein